METLINLIILLGSLGLLFLAAAVISLVLAGLALGVLYYLYRKDSPKYYKAKAIYQRYKKSLK